MRDFLSSSAARLPWRPFCLSVAMAVAIGSAAIGVSKLSIASGATAPHQITTAQLNNGGQLDKAGALGAGNY
jgi:hypothetical protein